jgi:hypothetical protein
MANRKQAKEQSIKDSQQRVKDAQAAPKAGPKVTAASKPIKKAAVSFPSDALMPGVATARAESTAPRHPRAALDQEVRRQVILQNSPDKIAELKRKNEMLNGADNSREQGEVKVSRYSDVDRRAATDRAGVRAEATRQEALTRYNEAPVSQAESKKAARRRAVTPRNSKN